MIRIPVENQGRGAAYVLAAPVVPGKEEVWRRFLQEVADSRAEYERLRLQLGMRRESLWLVPLTRGYVSVAYLEVEEDIDRLVRHLADTAEDFGLWFKAGIAECHGLTGATQFLSGSAFEPLLSWDEVLNP